MRPPKKDLLPSLRTCFRSYCIPLVSYLHEQLGVTYLVTHHLMSRIPFAPCQAQFINIVLHLKEIYNQQATYFLYFYGRIKHNKLKNGHLFSEIFQNGIGGWGSTPCAGRGTNPDINTPSSYRIAFHYIAFFVCWFYYLFCLKYPPAHFSLSSGKLEQWFTN